MKSGGIAWFARNPVAANLMMVFIITSGLIATTAVTEEVFPEVDLDRISIQVPYLGAAPEEVEEGVVLRIEEAIQGIDGIKQIVSTASEGSASVIVELELGADSRRVVDEVKNNVDAITTFPLETEEPIIRELLARNQVVDISIAGQMDIFALKGVGEEVRDELSALPSITQVDLVSAPPYEISIEVSEVALRRHGMTFDQVADAVRRSSLDLPGGSVRTDGGEILLRTIGQAYRGNEYEDLVLWTRPDGSRLRLGDVANVIDGFEETDQFARFDRAPTVMVSVFRTGDQSALDIAEDVTRYVEDKQAQLPTGVSMVIWQDQAEVLNDRLVLMLRNGATGFVLVFVVLALFLQFRLAFWVSLGIPISFLGAIALMPGFDVTVNVISLFAFILVLGIVVDDAIIVGENIFRHQENHGDGLRGSIEGAREIAKPVVFAVLTTVAAFMPLMFVPGMMGKIFRVIPLIVVPCLLFSLVESLGILPAHLSHVSKRRRSGAWHSFQQVFANGLKSFIRNVYQPLLETALKWRYVTAATGVGTLILTGGMVVGGWTNFQFFPSIEADFMAASVTMPQGTPADVTSQAVEKMEDGAARLRARLLQETGMDYFRHVSTSIGDQPMAARGPGPLGPVQSVSASNLGEVTIELAPAETRSYTSEQLGGMWRDATGAIPEAVDLNFSMSLMTPGDDVDVQLAGPDVDRLRAAAEAVKGRLAEYTGVYEISDSFRAGKEEMQLGIRPAAETLGLTLQDLGRQVRQAFYGEEAQRIQRGRDDIRVMVRYPRDERRSLGDLENMRIRTPNGGEVPFSQVAQVEPGRGFASIKRVDRNRAVNVTASVDPAVTSANAVIADLDNRILPELLRDYPGVFYTFEGAQAEQVDAVSGLQRGFVLALLMIFALLAVPLRSYVQPLIIMGAIPFGLVGAIWGHMIMRLDVTMMSMFGLVALTGVVVNDSLVMVDFINRARAVHADVGRRVRKAGGAQPDRDEFDSTGLKLAIREAGSNRFRPILLTSLTTFFGLAPLMLERSMQAAFLVPMAVSLAFGVLFATFITLILVPTAYLILDDIQRGLRWMSGRGASVVTEQADLPLSADGVAAPIARTSS
ncbi:MAG: efflux RND transporter permease subunit [Acidobacteria bacterium]|nr:efflux RND transporter permease subunit [Acidobacteriota bacterium]MXZ70101.1 efflux RND transporter permease subunit [Acidobacteriota bacterium]MYJ03128.1 efflux RND transporter permease subunit [Acidobacteriota bacterium]